ncbi:unnamed protein product [Eruca vesicaria subsp. sativa]|uniref:Uncharacterized protein n=1 Tax=Eruca vesicaria subsp. sativa TaxID=29727 RepID=A0ABC8IRM1_ERUVS|nr:unnamed protein product [Eruca vesicaria subsp. sativa]
MSKKKSSSSSSLKKLSQAGDKPSIQQKKPGKIGKEIDDIFGGGKNKKKVSQAPATVQTKPGKIGKEIDDIFGGRKKKKEKEVEEVETSKKKGVMAKRKRKRSDVEGFNNNNPKRTGPRKRTEDGLLVFTEEELGINKANAGNTRDCPFACNCCF